MAHSLFTGTNEDRHTIIAALRFWQQQGMCEPANRSDEFQNLATNFDQVTSLSESDLDQLVENINT